MAGSTGVLIPPQGYYSVSLTDEEKLEVDYNVDEVSLEIEISEGTLRCRRNGVARFPHGGAAAALDVYWLDIYDGGLWPPVGDETNGDDELQRRTLSLRYGAVKAANLGLSAEGRRSLLDFNFLYSPSCGAQRFMELPQDVRPPIDCPSR